jgi:hypothetical protein
MLISHLHEGAFELMPNLSCSHQSLRGILEVHLFPRNHFL